MQIDTEESTDQTDIRDCYVMTSRKHNGEPELRACNSQRTCVRYLKLSGQFETVI